MSYRRQNQNCSEDRREFTVLIYESEYRQIQAWVDKFQRLETGGDLFGLWSDERTAVVQLVLGPGERCKRTCVSFYQNVEYLERVGNQLTSNGLCHIGEWHSHHTLGLTRPSGGDENTVWSNMDRYDIERFFLFIATIESQFSRSDHVKVRCFLFERDSNTKQTRSVLPGIFKPMNKENPFRKMNTELLQNGAESQNSPQFLRRFKGLQEESTNNKKINQRDNKNNAQQERNHGHYNKKGKVSSVNKQSSTEGNTYTKRVSANVKHGSQSNKTKIQAVGQSEHDDHNDNTDTQEKLSVEKNQDKSENDEDNSGLNNNQHTKRPQVIHVESKDSSDVSTNATQPDETNPSTGRRSDEISKSKLQEENIGSSLNQETSILKFKETHGQEHDAQASVDEKDECENVNKTLSNDDTTGAGMDEDEDEDVSSKRKCSCLRPLKIRVTSILVRKPKNE